jgi:hypothetical protein
MPTSRRFFPSEPSKLEPRQLPPSPEEEPELLVPELLLVVPLLPELVLAVLLPVLLLLAEPLLAELVVPELPLAEPLLAELVVPELLLTEPPLAELVAPELPDPLEAAPDPPELPPSGVVPRPFPVVVCPLLHAVAIPAAKKIQDPFM